MPTDHRRPTTECRRRDDCELDERRLLERVPGSDQTMHSPKIQPTSQSLNSINTAAAVTAYLCLAVPSNMLQCIVLGTLRVRNALTELYHRSFPDN